MTEADDAGSAARLKRLPFGRNVFVTGLVSFFMDISSEMIYPLVPLFLANVLGVNKSVIGMIEGIAESTASIMKVFSGWFSDQMGKRKWLMAFGYGISTLSRPVIALSAGWHHVMGARFIDRLGKGVRTAPRDAIIAESAEKANLGGAFGFHRAMDTMGAVIGPALAFMLLGIFSNSYRLVFWLSLIPGAIAVLMIVLFVKETGHPRKERAGRPAFSLKQFDWKFKCFVLIAGLFALGNSSDAFLILRAEQVGVSSVMIPLMYLLFNLVYSISAIPFGMAADRFGRKRLILAGFVLFSLLYYGFAVVTDSMAVWVLFALYGVFMGLTEGIQKAFLATIIPEDFKATAFGIYSTVVGIAMFPASLAAGWLWDNVSPSATFYFGAITAALSALLFTIFIFFAGRSYKAHGLSIS